MIVLSNPDEKLLKIINTLSRDENFKTFMGFLLKEKKKIADEIILKDEKSLPIYIGCGRVLYDIEELYTKHKEWLENFENRRSNNVR